ncbi:hypothetical protein B0H34DRAFT_783573 [Crassisporium funariophilum]|nr:hypothetical protein B0H34DRAFT_783573 [Crassisporium funariophilum]
MPPVGNQDPNLKLAPDFNGPGYQNLRTLMAQAGNLTNKQIVEHLQTAYNTDKQVRIEAWNEQVRLYQEAEELLVNQAREDEERRQEEEERAAEVERKEQEKKKPKINDFDENKEVDSFITPRPSAFAMNKLKNYEYVELSYFTPEGCAAALEESKATADDAFGLTKVDGFMALRPVSSFKPLKTVIKDKDLTWRQMVMGKNSMLHHMVKLGWPEKHVNWLALFYFHLEDHPMRLRPQGDTILLNLQAVVRQEWHDALDQNEGFNISKINLQTLQNIADEFHDEQQAENLIEVSKNIQFVVAAPS